MTVLLSDDRIASIPAIENGEPRVDLFMWGVATTDRQFARESVADRLALAHTFLPGVRLQVVEGLRPIESRRSIYDGYCAELERLHPGSRITTYVCWPADASRQWRSRRMWRGRRSI
jgi:D-alanyl-D-alanine dipeptidase